MFALFSSGLRISSYTSLLCEIQCASPLARLHPLVAPASLASQSDVLNHGEAPHAGGELPNTAAGMVQPMIRGRKAHRQAPRPRRTTPPLALSKLCFLSPILRLLHALVFRSRLFYHWIYLFALSPLRDRREPTDDESASCSCCYRPPRT